MDINFKQSLINEIQEQYKLKFDTYKKGGGNIGVFGGVGPLATVDFQRKVIGLTPATTDQGHMRMVIHMCPQIPDRTQALLAFREGNTELAKEVVRVATEKTVEMMIEGEVSGIVFTCNTLHAFLPDLEGPEEVPGIITELKNRGLESVPIININTASVQAIQRFAPDVKKVGVLATTGTVNFKIYQNALEQAGLEAVVPADDIQEEVMEAIYGTKTGKGVKNLQATQNEFPEAKALFLKAWRHLEARGAEVAILGCTEIPLAITEADGPFVDASLILAGSAIINALQSS